MCVLFFLLYIYLVNNCTCTHMFIHYNILTWKLCTKQAPREGDGSDQGLGQGTRQRYTDVHAHLIISIYICRSDISITHVVDISLDTLWTFQSFFMYFCRLILDIISRHFMYYMFIQKHFIFYAHLFHVYKPCFTQSLNYANVKWQKKQASYQQYHPKSLCKFVCIFYYICMHDVCS